MTIRRLWVLYRGLPRDCNTKRVLIGDVVEWTEDTKILARLHNLTYRMNVDQKDFDQRELIQPPEPKPMN